MEKDTDITLLQQLLDEDNDENITLYDEAGQEIELEQIALIPHDKKLYAILRPLDADEDAAAVFKVDTDDEETLAPIQDETLASKILDIYNSQVATDKDDEGE